MFKDGPRDFRKIFSNDVELPKEKVIAQVIIRIPRGSCVTVIHQNIPSVGEETQVWVIKTGVLEWASTTTKLTSLPYSQLHWRLNSLSIPLLSQP